VCNVGGHLLPRHLILSRGCPTVERGRAPPLESSPRRVCAQLYNVGGHLLTSLPPFDPSSSNLREATPPTGNRLPPRVPRPASHPGRRSFQRGNRLHLAPLRSAPRLHSVPRLTSRDRRRALRLAPPPRRTSRPMVCATPCNPHCASRLEIVRTQVLHPSVADIRPLVLSDNLRKRA
jgi:hypothetical protein